MSFNLAELTKIRKATSGSERSKKQVANYIHQFKAKLINISELEPESEKKELIKLMNEESKKRKEAMSTGVSSYADPKWAGPSACETWTHCLLSENTNEIDQANGIIDELTDVHRVEESKKSNIFGYLVLFVGCPLAFYFFNWWIGSIVLFVGLVIMGWKNRYD